jgi:hypothetical protein
VDKVILTASLLSRSPKFITSQLYVFVGDNQADTDVTILNSLSFLGTPIDGFNMCDLKKSG